MIGCPFVFNQTGVPRPGCACRDRLLAGGTTVPNHGIAAVVGDAVSLARTTQLFQKSLTYGGFRAKAVVDFMGVPPDFRIYSHGRISNFALADARILGTTLLLGQQAVIAAIPT